MTPEEQWQNALEQLKGQMTHGTFDTHLRGTNLVSANDGIWQVAVKSKNTKDWLENRLLERVAEVAASVAGRAVNIQFVVAHPKEQNREALDDASVEDSDLWQPDSISSNGRAKKSRSKLSKPNIGSLAVDIRTLNLTGYQPLTNYYPKFIAPYLRQKWGSAGDKAFILWEQLVAEDGQQVTGDKFSNWTRARSYQLETLADNLGLSVQALTGRYGYCARFNLHKKAGAPLERCCRPDDHETEFAADRYCRYWRPGALEVLSAEGMLRVTEQGGRKNYRLTLQLWRSWPILTPLQVNILGPHLQKQHSDWLAKWQEKTGLTSKQWMAETAQSAIEQFPDRKTGLVCKQPFIRNPFWLKEGL